MALYRSRAKASLPEPQPQQLQAILATNYAALFLLDTTGKPN
jgi:hypothetical protein